jgi:hypothetical protein
MKIPGWEHPSSAELNMALDYTLNKLIDTARIHLDSGQISPLNIQNLTPDEIVNLVTGDDLDLEEGDTDGIGHETP